ncbi:DUF397 domain-containing protein [Nocardiopsis mwathae]|uniref:DUF397 domain-containing protein n=1 Tax=Nocardiopsis mwathae TaxID=1472723 RepID=UPI001622823E|nr:DUF397 domain-containing protein [Nocardiopsis mwathae]
MSTSEPSPRGWRKSSYSGNGPTCVEVGDLPSGRAVRDSRHPELGHLSFGFSEWRAFVSTVKST